MIALPAVRQTLIARLPEPMLRRLVNVKHGETALQRRFRGAVRERTKPRAVVRQFDAHAVAKQNRDAVTAALHRNGVPYVVVPDSRRGASVAVCEDDRTAAWAALCRELTADGWAAEVSRGTSRHGEPLLDTVPLTEPGLTAEPWVRLFRRLLAPSGVELADESLGCYLDFWRVVRKPNVRRADGGLYRVGTRVAPRPNGTVAYLTEDRWRTAAESGDLFGGRPYRPLLHVSEPVDLVYTWVDGLDPRWLSRKAAYSSDSAVNEIHESAVREARYFSRDELRYSLRSVAMYASWVRRIFIVTDDQIPPWLDANHPKIQMVDHKEIFSDPSVLPVFNSHAIESQLHHIAGLSEHYLYLNDDFFFGRPVTPETFFHGNGIAKFFLSNATLDVEPPSRDDLPVMSAAKRNRALLEKQFGATITQKFWHTPQPQLGSVLEEMERRHPEIFEQVARSRFRHPDDYSIPSALVHYYAFALGKAVPGKLRYRYQDIGTPSLQRQLDGLLRTRSYDVFCLNDSDSEVEQFAHQQRVLRDFLERYYPVPSPFERA